MEIDPRLHATTGSSSYGNPLPPPPPPSFTSNPIRLPPPHQQHPLPSSDLPALNHDGGQGHPYYTLPSGPHSHESHQQSGVHSHSDTLVALNTSEGSPSDPKRPRACEACRGLKVRCDLDTTNPEGACRRCAKAGRQCIVTVPSRKRQKKTDSRVAELEKKIDALTASLQATKHGAVVEPQEQSDAYNPEREEHPHLGANGGTPFLASTQVPRRGGIETNDWLRQTNDQYSRTSSQSQEFPSQIPTVPPPTTAGHKRRYSEDDEDSMKTAPPEARISGPTTRSTDNDMKGYPSNVHAFLIPKDTRVTKRSSVVSADSGSSQNNLPAHEYADVIDRKILEAGTATQIFDHYVSYMAPHLPAVVFPPQITAAEIRRTKSILFLAILSVSSGLSHPEIQRTLTKELMRVYADRIILKGEKTLELIQALQISALWYWPPEHYEELKFYQLIHIAAVMAIDVGLGKRTRQCKLRNLGLWRDHPWRKTPFPDPHSVESRRACTSMALRRPNLIRWTSYMDECIDILETCPDAYASDKVLCQWLKIQHIAEDIGIQFSMDDPSAQVGVSDTKVQYALKGFERQLEDWRKQIPKNIQSPSLELSEHVVNLYMHEVAMHTDHNEDDLKSNPHGETFRQAELLTPAHISALTVCLTSIHGIFDTFLALPNETIRNLPIFHFVRVAYACVLLIKMYFAATTANAELGKVISKEDMKVEYYLDSLLDAFRTAAEHEKSRPAQKFLMVLVMLKTWFQKQRDGKLGIPKDAMYATVGQHLGGNLRLGSLSVDLGPTETRRERATPRMGYRQIRLSEVGNGKTPIKHPGIQSDHREPSGNTPLHLLSEVAMGKSAVTPGGHMTSAGESWSGYNNQDIGTTSAGLQNPNSPSSGKVITDESDLHLDAAMGDGFEQAMGMTLGEGDLSSIFLGDGFFDMTLDGTPNFFDNCA
ncbi:MAG: hypothetical protein M1830_000209 [Pleopsidium flavum]|nr:MAG: hypothetical protein M1830_000209 [Pleopsidium flavum]